MSLASTVVWEVRTDGADTNGGGFKAGASGTDWSQQASAQYAVTDAVTNGTTTITSATANFGTDVVGNVLYIAGGTGSIAAGRYEITGRTNSTTITVDRSTGLTTGTGATLNIGGALASPGLALSQHVAGNTVWIRAGTYTISTATPGAGGPLHSTGSNVGVSVYGYTASRGDASLNSATLPVTLSCTAGTMSVVKLTAGGYGAVDCKTVAHLHVDANGQALVVGFELSSVYGGTGGAMRCKASSCAIGFKTSDCQAIACWATGCTTGFTHNSGTSVHIDACVAEGGTSGFVGVGNLANIFTHCVAIGCTGVGFTLDGYGDCCASHCTAHQCGSHGFARTGYAMGVFAQCLATNNGGYGYSVVTGQNAPALCGCAAYGNSSGVINVTPLGGGVTTLGTLPYQGGTLQPRLSARDIWTAAMVAPRAGTTDHLGAMTPTLTPTPRTRILKGR